MAQHSSSSERRVVITGVGAVTPVGNDMPTTWRNLIGGESGVGRIERFDPDAWGVKTPIAAEVKDWGSRTAAARRQGACGIWI